MSDMDDLVAIYRQCAPAIFRRTLALLKDEQEAWDVVQDSFLQYMQSQRSWRGRAQAFTILYQIATCRALDRLRHRSRWSGLIGPLQIRDEEDAEPTYGQPSSPAGAAAQLEALCDLAILTEGEQPEVLHAAVMHFIDRLPLTDVARELQVDRKKIRKMLDQFTQRALLRSGQLKPGGKS